MKAFFFLLLAANVFLGAWLLLGEPVDSVREPGRMQLQIEPGRFRVLSDADLARLRGHAAAPVRLPMDIPSSSRGGGAAVVPLGAQAGWHRGVGQGRA